MLPLCSIWKLVEFTVGLSAWFNPGTVEAKLTTPVMAAVTPAAAIPDTTKDAANAPYVVPSAPAKAAAKAGAANPPVATTVITATVPIAIAITPVVIAVLFLSHHEPN